MVAKIILRNQPMCFSPIASFVSGTILLTAGALSLHQSRSKWSIPFASIPVFFGIQQLVEGLVWISFDMPIWHTIATYSFVMFSHVFWPMFAPLTILLLEKDAFRKKLLLWITGLGFFVGSYLFICALIWPVTSSIVGHSIAYQIPVPFPMLSFFLYFLATCAGGMVSSSMKIRVFGSAMLLGFFVANSFYPETLFSVWCFFSACLSLIIYVHMRDLRKLLPDVITKHAE